jgi:TonB-dependent receptor
MTHFKRAAFVLLLLAFIMPFAAVAQNTGRVVGTITDRSTGDPLIGANILIQGTTIGAAADMDGRYVIRAVPPGTHTLVASYLGYQRETMEITVAPGQEVRVDVQLIWAGVVGDEVIITAQARGQTQAINEQLAARTIKNVVAADRIRELPDESAATAISRMPGISLDGDRVVVRGIQAKMNTVLVNGIQLPATTTEDRSTNLGFISSNMLSGIEVTKALTPDMDANSIGGVVNLRLREAPSGFRAEGMVQGGYNTQDRTYGNFQTWLSVSNRYLNDRLGFFVQGNLRQVDGGQDQARPGYAAYTVDPYPSALRPNRLRQMEFVDDMNLTRDWGGSIIADLQIPNGRLVLQNTYAHTSADIQRHFDRLVIDSGTRGFRTERDIHDRFLLVNALQGEHTFGGFRVDYSISHAQSQKDTDLNYWLDWSNNPIEAGGWTEWTQDQLIWGTPEDVYDIVIPQGMGVSSGANEAAPRLEYFQERQLNLNLNMTLPVTFSRTVSGTLQWGGKANWLTRENDVSRWFARMSDPANNVGAADYIRSLGFDPNQRLNFSDWRDPDYGRGDYFLAGRRAMRDVANTDWIDEYFRISLASGQWGMRHIADSRRFDYDADERLTAGYGMFDFALGTRINLLAGVRYENFSMDYLGSYTVQTHFMGDGFVVHDTTGYAGASRFTEVSRSLGHWFPNAQLRLGLTDWIDLRLAYTRSLSRPDYGWLVPSIFVDRSGRQGQAGNPYLNPIVANNYDAYLSFYTNRLGLFTVGGFYKRMDDVILQQNIQMRNLPENVVWPRAGEGFPTLLQQTDPVRVWLNNPNPAHIRGLEFDWQTVFWYLPAPFNSMVANINYTRIASEMDYQFIINQPGPIDPNTGQRDVIQIDTFFTNRLLHQGDNIINVALGADFRGFSGRISYRFQGDVVNAIDNRPENDTFNENIHGWDFTVRQNLPLQGMSMFFHGMNVTHAPTQTYRYFPRVLEGDTIGNINRTTYNPRRFELGLRYTY